MVATNLGVVRVELRTRAATTCLPLPGSVTGLECLASRLALGPGLLLYQANGTTRLLTLPPSPDTEHDSGDSDTDSGVYLGTSHMPQSFFSITNIMKT